MHTDFENLEKILRLEQSQGYHNTAVIGGLGAFAETWRSEALRESQDQARIDQISEIAGLLLRYAESEPADRSRTVEGLLGQLTQEPQEPAPRKPPLHKPGAKPAPPPAAAPASKPAPAAPASERPGSGLDAPVSTLPGVSTAYTARLRRLDIETVGDLLYHFPHRYDDYSSLKPISQLEYGDETTIVGTIWETRSRKSRGGREIITSVVADASGTIEAVWFNQPYLIRQLRAGRRIVLSGKVDEYLLSLIHI